MNQVVTIFYELKDANNGQILESNIENGGISFISGKNQIMQKLEEEVMLLKMGDKKEITLKAVDACGEYDSTRIEAVPKEQFAGIELKEGMELIGQGNDGQSVRVTVKNIGENEVMIDYNHPYAGKDLLFDIEVVHVREATEEEKVTGMVAGSGGCGCSTTSSNGGGCCGGGGGCSTEDSGYY